MKTEEEECMTEGDYLIRFVPPEEWSERDRQLVAYTDYIREQDYRNKWYCRLWRWVKELVC